MSQSAGFLRLSFAAALVWISGLPALAQGTADIVGTVTDNSASVISGAKITLKNAQTGLTRGLTTDTSGNYTAALLPVGTQMKERLEPLVATSRGARRQ